MNKQRGYTKYRFDGFSGYLLAPPDSAHNLISVRHTASIPPWSDEDVHIHSDSEEYYLLLQGMLRFHVDGQIYSLHPREILAIQKGVPHAVVGGEGLIEHFGFRTPAIADRKSIPVDPSRISETERDLKRDITMPWGFRASLRKPDNCHCWLIGKGEAKHYSDKFLFAFLDFPSQEQAVAGLGTRLRMHMHMESWEYYLCLDGSKTLQIDDEKVEVLAGEMVEVHPGTKHNVVGRCSPYLGATFRVPLLNDKVEY
jgi:mannose-6-phosphate isomerase-like protein (cupin superfamily)